MQRSLKQWQAVIDPMDRAQILGMAPRADVPLDSEDLAEFSFDNGLTLEVPETFMRNASVELAPDGLHITGSIEFQGPNPPATVDIAIPELSAHSPV